MLSDDIFRTKLALAISALRRWVHTIEDVAVVEETEGPQSWRLKIQPHARNACPVELLLRRDQLYDLQLGSEIYEDRVNGELELFEPLLRGVVAGNVITRQIASLVSGAVRSVETIVRLPDGRIWTASRKAPPFFEDEHGPLAVQTLAHDQHYVAYHRKAKRVHIEVIGSR